MNITVLGGSGFIGTRLVSQLCAAGHRVRIFDKAVSAVHPDLVTIGDVRDPAAVAAVLRNCECAINLAAEHSDEVAPTSLYFDVNVGGAGHLVAAAADAGVARIVFVSSVAVYGLDQPMASERTPLRPCNDYGRSKVQAEAVYTTWQRADPALRSLTVVRPCVVFGEGNRGNVHNLIDHLRRRRFVMVGRGDNRKSIAYVGNLVDFLCDQINNPAGLHCSNYADKPDLTTAELVRTIRNLLPNAERDSIHLPYPLALAAGYLFDACGWITRRKPSINSERIRKFCADTRIAIDALDRSDHRARVSIEEGLRRMIAHLDNDTPRLP